MLSPNAMNFVAVATGGGGANGTSVTTNEQAAVREGEAASDAVHETVVDPSGNVAPDSGEQLVDTGPTPPLVVGVE
jgi:hypothetical protein